MWRELPVEDKEEYKKMILAFASLTEAFAQKAEKNACDIPAPIINSKYQETIFQKAFHGSIEDIGNTSYDVALNIYLANQNKKYLIGIKTFGIGSGYQKIAQFKAKRSDWSPIINQIEANSINAKGKKKEKEEINKINYDLYKQLAVEISVLRNERIKSSVANIQGFKISENDEVESVYHVLMPSKKGADPEISVGETTYDEINIDKLEVLGCTTNNIPANFEFTDGKHFYRYTDADSQLSMNFNNKEIVLEKWPVRYADNAYKILADIADKIYDDKLKTQDNSERIIESYCWKITNKKDEVEKYSGFNGFYGIGSKLPKNQRRKKIQNLENKYCQLIDKAFLKKVVIKLEEFLFNDSSKANEKEQKIKLREDILGLVEQSNNSQFSEDVKKVLFRPKNEMYIPIPRSKEFHMSHPDFFGNKIGTFEEGTSKLALSKKECEFDLVFEPSGNKVRSFITQDYGKAIESEDKQSILGEWILNKVFQLKEYEPLTSKKLKEIGINGIRLFKTNRDSDVHLEFIWIGEDAPLDYIER
ncbi:MAG: NgoFVII family restriction endonuclease [Lachnospiraceae bacterium]|nr:NgoFVII family restriction endonuclease [Lachnospiraceae bacterium]